MDKVFCVFGTSITHGKGDFEQGGWVARLRKFFDQKNLANPENYFGIYELGVSGETTSQLLKRFEIECGARLIERKEYNEQAVIIFEIGINDSQFIHSKNGPRTSPGEFKENIKKLIEFSKEFTDEIIFLGLTPVDEPKTTPIPWNTDKSYKNENIQRNNEIIKVACEKNNQPFIEIFNSLNNEDLYDGLHPNEKGHQKIFEIVKDFLIENKII